MARCAVLWGDLALGESADAVEYADGEIVTGPVEKIAEDLGDLYGDIVRVPADSGVWQDFGSLRISWLTFDE